MFDIYPLGLIPLAIILLPLAASCGGPEAGSMPEQPIAFSHKTHAGEHEMPCMYCHRYADRSPVAGVPSVKTCMGCHEIIATETPGVEALTRFWEEKKPIRWLKVYDLPHFARFSHKRHVLGGVECADCHGAVQAMEKIHKVSDLSMGWCLSCHQEREADIDCLVCHF